MTKTPSPPPSPTSPPAPTPSPTSPPAPTPTPDIPDEIAKMAGNMRNYGYQIESRWPGFAEDCISAANALERLARENAEKDRLREKAIAHYTIVIDDLTARIRELETDNKRLREACKALLKAETNQQYAAAGQLARHALGDSE